MFTPSTPAKIIKMNIKNKFMDNCTLKRRNGLLISAIRNLLNTVLAEKKRVAKIAA
jgi:hypothetical protein